MSPVLREGDLLPEDEERFLAASVLGVDTETRGLVPHRDRLCLVQLHDGTEDPAVLVRIARTPEPRAPRLARVLVGSPLKVFHYARFDLATLRRHLSIEVQPAFCTMLASKLVRTYTNHHGLRDLVADLLGIEMDKRAQQTDWGADSYSRAQLEYAASDVTVLVPAFQRLKQMLEREERWDLAVRCSAMVPLLAELDLQGYDRDIFRLGPPPGPGA